MPFSLAIYQMELAWIRNIHNVLKTPWIDEFFRWWSFVDTLYFSTFLIVCAWYLWDRRIGIRLFYLLIMSLLINQTLKFFFNYPRPCQVDPAIALFCTAEPGFPSGAAQTATIIAGIIFLETKSFLYRIIGLVFAGLLCFSRVYLGMHYPTDILGGIFVGGCLLVLYAKGFPRLEKHWKVLSFVFPFSLILFGFAMPIPFEKILYFVCATFGVALGLLSGKNNKVKPKIKVRLAQTGMVLLGIIAFALLGEQVPDLKIVSEIAQGYWLSFFGARLFEL